MRDLTNQELEDIARGMDLAARNINIFSETFSRYVALEKKARAELQRRKK